MADADLDKIPVAALRKATIGFLSGALNPHKVIPTDDGLPRDWRGLADRIGLNGIETSRISSSQDPTAELISIWSNKGTIANLNKFLEDLDRFDVLDDYQPLLEKDIENYLTRVSNPTVSLLPSTLQGVPDESVLTIDDVANYEKGLEPQIYDAYLLYAEEDIEFASQIVDNLEGTHKMKLCFRDRDLVGGITFEHDAIMKLLAERCRRLVIVITPSFLQSPANKFFYNFAQALGIDQRKRKVIPILYKACALPPELSYYFLLDYNRAGLLWNFWDKLRDSIQTPDVSSSSSIWIKKEPLMIKENPIENKTTEKEEPEESKASVKSPKERKKSDPTSKKQVIKNISSSVLKLVKPKKDKVEKENGESTSKGSKEKLLKRKKEQPLLS